MTKTLFEHTEIAPPSDATSCPSTRIPWNFYTEEDDMTPQQIQQLNEASAGIIRLQQDINGLANVLDALPAIRNQLRYVYALAGKPWPFGS